MIRIVKLPLLVLLLLAVTACAGTDEPAIESGDLQAEPQDVTSDDDEEEGGTGDTEPADEASPVPDPDPSPTDTAVDEPAPTFDEVCAGRDDEAFIEVLTPMTDSTVEDPITVTGCGNTFEANYQYRLESSDGTVLVEDFGTMTCGNGCVGEFEFEVSAGTTGDVVLVVFETSAQDGSPQNVVEVPLTVG